MDKEKNDLVHALTTQVESQQATITELTALLQSVRDTGLNWTLTRAIDAALKQEIDK